jgi:hypothetical protein
MLYYSAAAKGPDSYFDSLSSALFYIIFRLLYKYEPRPWAGLLFFPNRVVHIFLLYNKVYYICKFVT